MKKKFNISVISIIFFVVGISIIYISLFNIVQYSIAYKSSEKLTSFYVREPLRFKIYGHSFKDELNTISARFEILDRTGQEITAIERSWTGSYLAVEFINVHLNSKEYIFPYNIYGKEKIFEKNKIQKKGSKLAKYYIDDNECLLFGKFASEKLRKYLYRIYVISNPEFPLLKFGNTSKITIDLSNCIPDKYYSIIMNEKGEFSIAGY